jgi:hypothetical protein
VAWSRNRRVIFELPTAYFSGCKAGARGDRFVPTAGRAVSVRDCLIQCLGREVDRDDRRDVGHAEPVARDERHLAQPDFEIGIEVRNPLRPRSMRAGICS